jgi:Glycosyl transferase family 2
MDQTKARIAAMTMVKGDAFFLQRWVDYYGKHLGRENLFVLSHGGEPETARIADGCNVIYLPHDPTRYCFNQRRWQMLSHFASAFTNAYNWVICGDVDELIAVDPDVSDSLSDYLMRFEDSRPPAIITPFAIEIVHKPDEEPEALEPGRNILDVRRHYRQNINYCKPCIVRKRVTFSPGGHFANEREGFVDPHLYLFHLRFVDYQTTHDRLALRREQRTQQSGALGEVERKVTGWDTAWTTFQGLSKRKTKAETADFPEVRAEMMAKRYQKGDGVFWAMGGQRSYDIYKLPERFARLF